MKTKTNHTTHPAGLRLEKEVIMRNAVVEAILFHIDFESCESFEDYQYAYQTLNSFSTLSYVIGRFPRMSVRTLENAVVTVRKMIDDSMGKLLPN